VKFAKENPVWGYDCISGALSNLGYNIRDATMGNILGLIYPRNRGLHRRKCSFHFLGPTECLLRPLLPAILPFCLSAGGATVHPKAKVPLGEST
jgi:hypothetical protein